MAKKTVKVAVAAVPKSMSEAVQVVFQIGEHQRHIDAVELEYNKRIQALKEIMVKEAEPYQKEIDKLFAGLYVFAEKNRQSLTDDGKRKTVDASPAGEFGWRLPPHSISFHDKKAVIAELKKMGLSTEFIRIEEEVNKEAMLKDEDARVRAAKVKGLKVVQQEYFYVKPAEVTVTQEVQRKAEDLRALVGG